MGKLARIREFMSTYVRVFFWIGNTQYERIARTYKGAIRIANRNNNAYDAKFYSKDGIELFDTGNNLVDQNLKHYL